MAKYTETYAEYVEGGGVVPSSSFALVTDFENLFLERFCGNEIGFETEALFTIKLDLKARLVMPLYAARIAAVDAAISRLETPTKERTEVRNYGAQHSASNNDGTNTELPFNTENATPSSTSTLAGSTDLDEHEDNLTYNDYVTIDENLRIIDGLGQQRQSLIEKCLDEFKPLFMEVY